MKSNVEHERKLEAPSGFELPDLGGEALEPRVFTSVYHDTPTRSLARSGITLRRRTERGRSVWQLKLPLDGARLELEEPGGPIGPPEKLRVLLRAHERTGALGRVAELRTRRHGTLVTKDGSAAEVTVDEVSVMDAQRVADEFVELEIELVEGDPAKLAGIAKQLERAGAQSRDLTPKLLRVLELEPPEEPRGPFDALVARLRAQRDQILAHDPGTRLGKDPESLHDMRVAVRRTRALLRAGKPLATGDTQMLELELKWLGTVLGNVRDLDVLLAHLRKETATLDDTDRAAASRLLRTLDRRRSRARSTLLKALDSERYGNLLDRFESTLDSLEPAASDATLTGLARKEMKRLKREVRALSDEPADEELHALRKRCKRARYAHELAGKDAVVARAKALQDVLGEHQDSVVAEERLRGLAGAAPSDQAVAAGRLIERERARQADARASWQSAWRKLERAGG